MPPPQASLLPHHSPSRLRRLATCLLSLALTACGHLTLRDDASGARPEIPAATIEVLSLTPRAAQLRLTLNIDNPGDPLTAQEATLEWMLDEQRFAVSRHSLNLPIPARQVSDQAFDVSLAYFSLPFMDFSGARRDEFQLIVQGNVAISAQNKQLTIPFSAQTQITRPQGGFD